MKIKKYVKQMTILLPFSVANSVAFLTLFMFAGPFTTQTTAANPGTNSDRPAISRGFFEFAPIISKVLLKKGDPFVEVFLEGEIPDGHCFDKKEYVVEVKNDFTQVLVRFRQNNPDAECNEKARAFSDKIADLDPANPASRSVRVLGFYGWTQGALEDAAESK